MAKEVVVYSKVGCGQCQFTKKHLQKLQVDFIEKDISQNPAWLEEILAWGFQSLPVVKIEGEEPFHGYKPERLDSLVQ